MKGFKWFGVRWNEIVGAFFYGIKQQTVATDAREKYKSTLRWTLERTKG